MPEEMRFTLPAALDGRVNFRAVHIHLSDGATLEAVAAEKALTPKRITTFSTVEWSKDGVRYVVYGPDDDGEGTAVDARVDAECASRA